MIEKGIIGKDKKRKEIEDKYKDWIPEDEKEEKKEEEEEEEEEDVQSQSSTPLPALEDIRNAFLTPSRSNVQHVPFTPDERQQLKDL